VSNQPRFSVTVCVGSSCHIKGARNVIKRFNEIIGDRKLDGTVELKGSFCMDRCGEGFNWQIDERPFTSQSVEEAERILLEEVINPLVREQEHHHGKY
jgi:NADH:ubiquinone oxidoreductase subunit E